MGGSGFGSRGITSSLEVKAASELEAGASIVRWWFLVSHFERKVLPVISVSGTTCYVLVIVCLPKRLSTCIRIEPSGSETAYGAV